MQLRNAIGMDPDSQGIICSYVKSNIEKPEKKGFLATKKGLNEFVSWLLKQNNVIVAIEGQNGQSKPVEKILRKSGIIFYSFKPYDVDKFRKAVLGQNKNNHKDAESVARYAMALEAQGKMDYILLEHVEFGPRCRRLLHVPPRVGRMSILIMWLAKSKLRKRILIYHYPKKRDALHGQDFWQRSMKFVHLPVQNANLI